MSSSLPPHEPAGSDPDLGSSNHVSVPDTPSSPITTHPIRSGRVPRRPKRRESFAASANPSDLAANTVNENRLFQLSKSSPKTPRLGPFSRVNRSRQSSPSGSVDLFDHRSIPLSNNRAALMSSSLRYPPPSTAPLTANSRSSGGGGDQVPLLSSTPGPSSSIAYGTSLPGPSHIPTAPRRSQTLPITRSPLESPSVDPPESYHDVNNPPSVPGTPLSHNSYEFQDDDGDLAPESSGSSGDAIIDIDGNVIPPRPSTPSWDGNMADDICDLRDEANERGSRLHKRAPWPNLAHLEAFCQREAQVKNKKGHSRMRSLASWRWPGDAPPRFSYFNVDMPETIHAQTLSGLTKDRTFRELFLPEPTEIPTSGSDDDDDDDDDTDSDSDDDDNDRPSPNALSPADGDSGSKKTLVGHSVPSATRSKSSINSNVPTRSSIKSPTPSTGRTTPAPGPPGVPALRARRFGNRPTFWLDVTCPTRREIRVLKKAFGLHPLTAEDILMEDAREKVELFNHYYFVSYCSFEQDKSSPHYMERVNIYAVVFREGIITFHWSLTPHPANVRRRTRQVADSHFVSADWISYALIDDITDSYLPVIEGIKDEVDEVDDAILLMYMTLEKSTSSSSARKRRHSRGRAESEAQPNPPPSSWFSRLSLRRRSRPDHNQADLYQSDPEHFGTNRRHLRRTSSHGFSARPTMLDLSNDGLSTGLSRSGLWRRRPSRPSPSAARDWHPVRNQRRRTFGYSEKSDASSTVSNLAESDTDLLFQVSECRKKVMSMFRLLGNKADVIKSFAKRCNEQCAVAPHSEIGMYLSDIQDHIVTMTGNLGHYETLLSRAHSNYLAQMNIRMTQRAETTNDVLNKLTVLGTIVLPMNIVTGMWGMNVLVPGQGVDDSLTWFWCITLGLALFGLTSFLIAKKTYGIV